MDIFNYKNSFNSLLGSLSEFTSIEYPIRQQVIYNSSRISSMLELMPSMTSSVLEPANNWISLLNEAQNNIDINNLLSCHTNLSVMMVNVNDSISNLSLKLSVIEGTSEEIENSLNVINQEYQSNSQSIDANTYKSLRSNFDEILDVTNSFSRFSELVINDMKAITNTLNIGVSPYNYEMYNSVTILRMKIMTSRSDIQSLRIDFFG